MNAIIFDLDGVVCFIGHYYPPVWKQAANSIGVYFDEQVNNRLHGIGRMDSLDIILEKSKVEYPLKEKRTLVEEKNKKYVQLLNHTSTADLSDKVKGVLQELYKRGYKLAIGSSNKNTKYILKRIGPEHYPDAVSNGTMIKKSKPDPEVFLKVAEMLQEKPGSCLVVEDALAGVEAAWRGGFFGAGMEEAATHKHVTPPIKRLSDLLTIMKEQKGNRKINCFQVDFFIGWEKSAMIKQKLRDRGVVYGIITVAVFSRGDGVSVHDKGSGAFTDYTVGAVAGYSQTGA